MAVGVKVGSFTKSGTSNTISTTFKVKALIVYCPTTAAGAAQNSYGNHGGPMIGISDGTTNYVSACISNDALATSDTYQTFNTFVAVTHISASTLGDTGVATFGASTDFTIDWTNSATPVTPTFSYIALGGDDITNAKVLQFDATASAIGNRAYTGVGFQPNWGFVLVPFKTTTGNNLTYVNSGFGTFMSPTQRWSLAYVDEDGATTQDSWRLFRPDSCTSGLNNAGSNTQFSNFVSWDTDGWTWDWDDVPTNTTDKYAGLFIKGGKWDVGVFTKPTTTGAQSQNVTLNDSTLTPKLVILASEETTSAQTTPVNQMVVSFGATDGTSEASMWSGCGPDASDPMINANISLNNKVLRLAAANATHTSSTTNAECSVVTGGSMSTAGQFTLSWTTNANITAHQVGYVVLGDSAAGAQFNRSPTAETITVADSSVTRLYSAARVPSADTTTITDSSLTRIKQAFRSPTADTIAVSDSSLTAVRVKAGVPSADSTTVSDVSLVRMLSSVRTPSVDTTVVGETSLTRNTQAFRTVPTDTATVIDASLTRIRGVSRVPSADSITVADTSLTRLLALVRLPSTDTTVVSAGSATRLYSGLRVPSADTTALSESVTGEKSVAGINYTRSPAADTTTVSDGALIRVLTFLRVPSAEIVNIIDSALTRIVSLFRSPVSDSTSITDVSLVRVLSKSRAPPEDTVPILDSSLTRLLTALRTPSQDTSVVSDNLTRMLQLTRVPSSDSTALSENVSRIHTTAGQYNRNVSDTVGAIQESLQRLLSLKRLPSTDTSAITENLQRAKIISKALGDTINIIDVSVNRSLTAIRNPTSDTSTALEASLVRMLSATRSPTADTTTVSELVGLIGFSRSLQETIPVTEPLLQRIVTTVRQLTESTEIAESLFFETYKRLVFDSVIVADQLFSERALLSGPTTYAIPDEVRPLLGNLGSQRTDAQIALAVDAAYDEINTKTNRIPPNDWKDTDHNFGIVKKLARYIAAREMAVGIKDFDTRPLDMEIEHLFKDLLEYDTTASSTQDIVGSSPDVTYALQEGGLIWSTRYKSLRKGGSSGENDSSSSSTTINPDT